MNVWRYSIEREQELKAQYLFICSFQVYGMGTLFRLIILPHISGRRIFSFNLRDDTLSSAQFPLQSVFVFYLFLTSFFSVRTVLKLSYKTNSIFFTINYQYVTSVNRWQYSLPRGLCIRGQKCFFHSCTVRSPP